MPYKKLRRSGRISKSVPILLIGSDTEGRVFSEATYTVVLSLHGAGIVSAHKLLAEQELVLRSLETNREAEIHVVGEIAAQGGEYTYGVAFVDDSIDFWQMEFPPPPSLEERPLELQLECSGCGSPATVWNGDYEFDVCAIHGGLVKYCGECGFPTVWRRPEPGAEPRAARKKAMPKPVIDSPHEAPGASLEPEVCPANDWNVQPLADPVPPRSAPEVRALATGGPATANSPGAKSAGGAPAQQRPRAQTAVLEDRRGRVRAKVNYFACVRSEAFGDDVVRCIDMSRGGLGFRTKNPYAVSTEVRVAVPFSPGSPNAPTIFVAARIVNVSEIPEQNMFRCGVMFLPERGAHAHR